MWKIALALGMACAAAFWLRMIPLYSFDPVLNKMGSYRHLRFAQYIDSNGITEALNWWDHTNSYPHGTVYAQHTYPGLAIATVAVHKVLSGLGVSPSLLFSASMMAPICSILSVLLTYKLAATLKDRLAGILSAIFIAFVPGYAAQSMAGSFDGEAIAIPFLMLANLSFIIAIMSKQSIWAIVGAVAYFVVASCWSEYIIFSYAVSAHVMVLFFIGDLDHSRLDVYNSFYLVSTVLLAQIGPVGLRVLYSKEHWINNAVFAFLQCTRRGTSVDNNIAATSSGNQASSSLVNVCLAVGALQVGMSLCSRESQDYHGFDVGTDDLLTAAELVPSSWASFFYDIHYLMVVFPVGLYLTLHEYKAHTSFNAIYSLLCLMYAGLSVKMMVVLAGPASVLAGVAVSSVWTRQIENRATSSDTKKKNKPSTGLEDTLRSILQTSVLLVLLGMLVMFLNHSIWLVSKAYSTPSLYLTSKYSNGTLYIFDDFRDSQAWITNNVPEDSTVLSWWDYGPIISGMGNRTVYADTIPGNQKSLAMIGQAMALPEREAASIVQHLGASYVFVVFGGYAGHSSDDLNKFTWMLRAAAGAEGSTIRESDYFSTMGSFRVDRGATAAMRESLLYKLSYFRFGSMYTDPGQPSGFDRVRKAEIGSKDIILESFEEVYTSKHWLVRIYKVKDKSNRV